MKFENYMLSEGINDKGIFKAVFLAGTPGSGKSFIRKKLGGGVEPRTVNSDTWVEFLGVGGKGQWDFFQDKIQQISLGQLTNYINSMLPLWIDSTSSMPDNVTTRKGILEGFGYDTGMLWVNTDLETAKKRALEREKRIGRHVDTKYIDDAYDRINRFKSFYKSNFKWFVEVDNNDGELTDEVVTKLYKNSDSFFKSPLQSPIGNDHIDYLRKNQGKYLEDGIGMSIQRIKQRLQGWRV